MYRDFWEIICCLPETRDMGKPLHKLFFIKKNMQRMTLPKIDCCFSDSDFVYYHTARPVELIPVPMECFEQYTTYNISANIKDISAKLLKRKHTVHNCRYHTITPTFVYLSNV